MELCDLLITDTDLLIRADHLEKSVDIAIKDGNILETGTGKYPADTGITYRQLSLFDADLAVPGMEGVSVCGI